MAKSAPGRRALGLLLVAGVSVTGLLGTAGCRRGAPERTLRVGVETEVLSDDPIAASDAVTNSVLANVFEPLVAFDADMVLGPRLAVSWETTDPTTWVLRLRPGVTFQDGTPLTAHEVRVALERARNDPGSAVKGALFSVRSVEEVDPATVWIATSRPDPLLLNRLAQVPIARRSDGRFVGTGPYALARWSKGKPFEVDAFAGYWGGRPRIARAVFVTVPSGPGVVEALRSRSVDILRFVPETLVDEVRRLRGVRVVARTGLTSTYLWMDARPREPKNPFADVRVRRAVSLAIDRAALVRALSGNALALDQAIPRGIFGHVATLGPVGTDPAEARRLLHEAGYPDGFATTLTRGPGPASERVAALVAASLGGIGIRVSTLSPPWEEMFEAWRTARIPFFVAAWRFDNGDAASFLQDCLVTRSVASGFGRNNPGYSNPALDALVEESERVVEPAKRLVLYEEISRILAADVPAVPLYHRYNLFATSDALEWQPRLDGRILVVDVAFGRASDA